MSCSLTSSLHKELSDHVLEVGDLVVGGNLVQHGLLRGLSEDGKVGAIVACSDLVLLTILDWTWLFHNQIKDFEVSRGGWIN